MRRSLTRWTMHEGVTQWQARRYGSDKLSLGNDLHDRKRDVRGRLRNGFQNRPIVHRTIWWAARMQLRHSGVSTLTGHFLAAFFFGRCHRLSLQGTVQQWQAKKKKCQKPTADFTRAAQQFRVYFESIFRCKITKKRNKPWNRSIPQPARKAQFSCYPGTSYTRCLTGGHSDRG